MTGTDKDQTEGDDQTEGLAQQSLNTSVMQPGRSGACGPGHGDRGLTGNDQRKGLEDAGQNRPNPESHRKKTP